jgi:hypothetical protein
MFAAIIRRRLVARQQLGCPSPTRLILEVHIRERLAVVVAHDKAGVLFLDRPRRDLASSAFSRTADIAAAGPWPLFQFFCLIGHRAPLVRQLAIGTSVSAGGAAEMEGIKF